MVKGGTAFLLLALALSAPADVEVWAEASLSHDRAYVQEMLVYRVRIFSVENLRRISIVTPRQGGISLEKLDGPRTRAEEIGGKRYILSEFRYALTPLVSGSLNIAPSAIKVELRATPDPRPRPLGPFMTQGLSSPVGSEEHINVSTENVYLVVFPPFRQAEPWLPLRSLALKARWSRTQVPTAGEPVRLTVEMTARGSMGSRIPSLGKYLRPVDISVYPIDTDTTWALAEDGRELLGRRIETYTLVPRREGALTVPALRIRWWDAVGNRRAFSELPAKLLRVGAAEARGEPPRASARPSAKALPASWRRVVVQFLLPLVAGLAVALLAGWWMVTDRSVLTAWRRGARLRRQPEGKAVPWWPSGELMRGSIGAVAVIARQRAEDFRLLTPEGRSTGKTMRLRLATAWLRARLLRDMDAAAISGLLRRFAAEELGMSSNMPLQRIAERLAEPSLSLDQQRLVRLFERLDAALYGKQVMELRSWKRELRRCLIPPRGPRRHRRPGSVLPALNP